MFWLIVMRGSSDEEQFRLVPEKIAPIPSPLTKIAALEARDTHDDRSTCNPPPFEPFPLSPD
jgi:hypothetical protein